MAAPPLRQELLLLQRQHHSWWTFCRCCGNAGRILPLLTCPQLPCPQAPHPLGLQAPHPLGLQVHAQRQGPSRPPAAALGHGQVGAPASLEAAVVVRHVVQVPALAAWVGVLPPPGLPPTPRTLCPTPPPPHPTGTRLSLAVTLALWPATVVGISLRFLQVAAAQGGLAAGLAATARATTTPAAGQMGVTETVGAGVGGQARGTLQAHPRHATAHRTAHRTATTGVRMRPLSPTKSWASSSTCDDHSTVSHLNPGVQ